jgi:hypothetical protein
MIFAAEETYVIDSKGESTKAFRVMADGKRVEIEDPDVGVSDAEAHIYWLPVDGGENGREEMAGSKSGIYFFDNKDKPLYFLPFEETRNVSDISFSPDRKHILLVKSGLVLLDLTLFAFGDVTKKALFESLSDLYWIDANRFVFAMVEPGKEPRPLPDDSEEEFDGWSSVVICDSEGKITQLLEATETKNYMLGDADIEEKTFIIYETTVKTIQDWADMEKQEVKELTVPFPGK